MANEREAKFTPVWPDTLSLRDTGLHDDLGGLGQRIYTTAGAGYEKRVYVRDDLAGAAPEMLDALRHLLVGCEFKTLYGVEGWHLKTMPSDAALNKARFAIAKATGEQS